jgi:distribution and morphology protein 34
MAFNFNWSPLAADEDFYQRARDLLTTALNKSPKPPIIVDDIFVTEFNLGSVPPDLEILEIGDLAEDRFRGIFKMCYSGDAFLTLKTRVQVQSALFAVIRAFVPGLGGMDTRRDMWSGDTSRVLTQVTLHGSDFVSG